MRKMKKRNVICLAIMLLFLVGCAPRITILLDGAPIPNHSYILSNPATDLKIEIVIARWYYIFEEGERVLWPQYLSLNKKHYINPENTEFIEVAVKVSNPNKVWYSIDEVVNKNREVITTELYKGRLRHKRFVIRHFSSEEGVYNITVNLKDKSDFPIVRMGEVIYEIRNPITEEGGDM